MNGETSGLNLIWQVIKFIFFFALVIGMVYATTRLVGKRMSTTRGGKYLHVVESVPIGQKAGLHLVELAGRVLLVGLAEGQMNVLTTFTGPEATRLLAEGGEEVPVEESTVTAFRRPQAVSFAEEMQRKIERLKALGTRRAGETAPRGEPAADPDGKPGSRTESDED